MDTIEVRIISISSQFRLAKSKIGSIDCGLCNSLETTMKKVRLPSSKAVVSVPCHDAGECIVSLLTDPRIKDDDYLFL